MSLFGKKIAVVIPSYRAAHSIGPLVERIPDYVDSIIIVDDCSPDDLGTVVGGLRDERIAYLRHERNQGVGGAMVTGFRKALELKADLVCKVDADGQMDPKHLGAFAHAACDYHCDYVKANRFGHIEALRSMPRRRLWGNVALSVLTKISSGCWNVFDPQNGYVMITRRMLCRLNLEVIDRGYFFENSMLINLNILGARIGEVYIPAKYDAEVSSLHIGRILYNFPVRLLKGLIYRVYQKYIFRSVSPVLLLLAMGVPALMFGVIWGAVAWIRSYETGITASTGTVVLSLLPLLIGAMCILQALVLDVQLAGPTVLADIDEFDDISGHAGVGG